MAGGQMCEAFPANVYERPHGPCEAGLGPDRQAPCLSLHLGTTGSRSGTACGASPRLPAKPTRCHSWEPDLKMAWTSLADRPSQLLRARAPWGTWGGQPAFTRAR